MKNSPYRNLFQEESVKVHKHSLLMNIKRAYETFLIAYHGKWNKRFIRCEYCGLPLRDENPFDSYIEELAHIQHCKKI